MLIADLHIHSKYSRATSHDCEPEMLDLWARRKGHRAGGHWRFLRILPGVLNYWTSCSLLRTACTHYGKAFAWRTRPRANTMHPVL